ncbi:MAG TPA: VOC family protein [Thermoanaerobaculia bacterium]|nr:VOC family protein [Thermoanaerobaculia bacterium]
MLANRSIPRSSVIPELPYGDVNDAAAWLTRAFGFTVRVSIGDHRIQLNVEDGAVVLVQGNGACRLLVRVEDVDAHHERAVAAGARIVRPPATHAYGERQYTAQDPGGHTWTFSQSVEDVAPESWGGTSVHLE